MYQRPFGLPIPIKRVEQSPSREDSLELAFKWLEKCTTSHPSCQVVLSGVKPPSRLLSIGGLGTEHLRLIEPDGPLTWVSLTHRWGEEKHSCLTQKANYESQLRHIPRWSFPRTFQDAVIITRRLGYQYIWVDCLCIIRTTPMNGVANRATWLSTMGELRSQ